jgi:hypothetical protein
MSFPAHTPQFRPEILIMRTNYEASKNWNFSSFVSFHNFTLNTLFNSLFLKTPDLNFLFYVTDQVPTHIRQDNTTALHILNFCVVDGRQEHKILRRSVVRISLM